MLIANGDAICNSLGMFFSLQRFLAAEGPMVQATVFFILASLQICYGTECASPELRVPGWAAM